MLNQSDNLRTRQTHGPISGCGFDAKDRGKLRIADIHRTVNLPGGTCKLT